MLMDIFSHMFHIFQSEVVQIVLRAKQTLDDLFFFQKEVLVNVRFEIQPVQRNIVSSGQSVLALKIYSIQACPVA